MNAPQCYVIGTLSVSLRSSDTFFRFKRRLAVFLLAVLCPQKLSAFCDCLSLKSSSGDRNSIIALCFKQSTRVFTAGWFQNLCLGEYFGAQKSKH